MASHLLFAVRLYADGMGVARYHGMSQGAPEWPPSPARIFQALVAGVARGNALPEDAAHALRWLEQLPPPLIASPWHAVGQAVALYVPNNDADALPDPADVSSIRTAKQVQPSLFDGTQPILYAWTLPEEHPPLHPLVEAAHALYQLGRGGDMAWADLQVLDDASLQAHLARWRGVIHRPDPTTAGGRARACPMPGSLASLVERHAAPRLRVDGAGKKARVLFTNPPKPRFAAVAYGALARRYLYDLRERGTSRPWPWALHRAALLVEQLREAAAARLHAALGDVGANAIESSLRGKAAGGSSAVPLEQRVRITPLPSIGSMHADQAIRRVLVEVPCGCPLSAADLDWAFSGLDTANPETGELSPWLLTKADQWGMLDHYSQAGRHWLSVTAVALPEATHRRRIDPARRREQAKAAPERQAEEARAVAAVHAALRHAGIAARAVQVRVQREPFAGAGHRAEAFAEDTRFAKERLWHVALGLDRPVAGPLAIGDGRFLGLGLLAPAAAVQGGTTDPALALAAVSGGVMALSLEHEAAITTTDPIGMARALRRAVMARMRDFLGLQADAGLPRYFSGHAEGTTAADAEPSRHLAFHWDALHRRWLVLAPHRLLRRRPARWEREHLATLSGALDSLDVVRAGSAGAFLVQRAELRATDGLLAPARTWQSVTPYLVTRHRRLASAADALKADAMHECRRCGLPDPEMQVLALRSVPGRGLQGELRLRFPVAVEGPLALGRTSLLGGGLFIGVADESDTSLSLGTALPPTPSPP